MDNEDRIKLANWFVNREKEQIAQGDIPDRILMGPLRHVIDGESVDPRYIHDINGQPFVPTRLYPDHRENCNLISVVAEIPLASGDDSYIGNE